MHINALFRYPVGLMIVCGFFFLTGCAGMHTIKLDTNPTGAKVILDGKSQSDTPSRISVKKDGKAHYLFLKKTGCRELRRIFRNNDYPKELLLDLDCDLRDADEAARLAAERAKQEALERQKALEEERLEAQRRQQKMKTGDLSDPRTRFLNEDVYFDYDSSSITTDAFDVLQAKADWLRENPRVIVVLQGHTDERGTVTYNLALGDRRAQSVRNFLMELGISGQRLNTVSYGEEFPANSEHHESAWAQNRRVHVDIQSE